MDFSQLYQKHGKDIRLMCRSIENNLSNTRIELDDLLQEANLKLWELSKSIGCKDDKSWLLISIKNHLLNYIKSFKKDVLYEAESLEEFSPQNY